MKKKICDLTNDELDRAVEKCEGLPSHPFSYPFSSNWSFAGPIIERERIRLVPWDRLEGKPMHGMWYAAIGDNSEGYSAETPLIAAMRCYVAWKMGRKITVS